MTADDDRVYRQAPLVWRSTMRGVLVLDTELRRLEGLGAAVWLALEEGPASRDALVARLEEWSVGWVTDELDVALAGLRAGGLVLT